MRIAVYGGSFNPPHVGHGLVAAWLRWTERADEVWLLPCFDHPFEKEMASFEHRVAMCRELAVAVGPWVKVNEVERTLPSPSFTIDTLDALAGSHPEHRFRWVLGADLLPTVGRWKRWDRIEAEYSPIVVGRGGYTGPSDALVFPDVSSTEIRRRVRSGEPIDHLVPAGVARLMVSRN